MVASFHPFMLVSTGLRTTGSKAARSRRVKIPSFSSTSRAIAAGEFPMVEILDPLLADSLQTVGETRDPNEITLLQKPALRAMDHGSALGVPPEDPLSAELQIEAGGSGKGEAGTSPVLRWFHQALPGKPSIRGRSQPEAGQGPGGRDRSMTDRGVEPSPVFDMNLANSPSEPIGRKTATGHLRVSIDRYGSSLSRIDRYERTSPKGADPRFRDERHEYCGDRGVHRVTSLVRYPGPRFRRDHGARRHSDSTHDQSFPVEMTDMNSSLLKLNRRGHAGQSEIPLVPGSRGIMISGLGSSIYRPFRKLFET